MIHLFDEKRYRDEHRVPMPVSETRLWTPCLHDPSKEKHTNRNLCQCFSLQETEEHKCPRKTNDSTCKTQRSGVEWISIIEGNEG